MQSAGKPDNYDPAADKSAVPRNDTPKQNHPGGAWYRGGQNYQMTSFGDWSWEDPDRGLYAYFHTDGNANNTHTGAVTVSQGNLTVNGALPSSSVAVSSGATLSGVGAMSGVVIAMSAALVPTRMSWLKAS